MKSRATQKRVVALVAAIASVGILSTMLIGTGSANVVKLVAPLRGGEGMDPDGKGWGVLKLNADKQKACWKVVWNNVDDQPFASHVHVGEAGTAGPPVIPIFVAESSEGQLPANIKGVVGCTSGVSADLIREIKANPSGYYINIHTPLYPGEAIRGQLKHPNR